jgi:hypothetical protein
MFTPANAMLVNKIDVPLYFDFDTDVVAREVAV